MSERPTPAEGARLLRQRVEMGARELFLDGLTREEAIRLARAAAHGRGTRPGPGQGAEPTGAATPRTIPAQRSASDVDAPRPRAAGDPTAATPVSPLELPDDYDALRTLALGCTRCALCQGRTQVVFSDGSPTARLMVVGEAPGANED